MSTLTELARTQLVHLRQGKPVTDSLSIAAGFGRRHSNVLQSLDDLIADGTISRLDFKSASYMDEQGKTRRMIELTERGALTAMPFIGGKNSRIGQARLVDEFLSLRAELEAPTPALIPQTLPEALRLAADMAEQKAKTEAALAVAAPKAEALDRIADADGLLTPTDAAKTLQVRPKELFDFLRANRWIYNRAGSSENVAYQDKIQSGLLAHKTNTIQRKDGTDKVVHQVLLTAKGLTKLAQTLRN